MIPMDYIVALTISTLLVLYRLVNVTNKYVNILVNGVLSLADGAAWIYLSIVEYNLHLWGNEPTFLSTLLLIIIIDIPVGFILMVFTWRETPHTQQTNEIQETYTEDTLIGMTGVVIQQYSDNSYLCKLTDNSQTSIVVYLDDAKEGDKFIIKKIENGRIIGSVVVL